MSDDGETMHSEPEQADEIVESTGPPPESTKKGAKDIKTEKPPRRDIDRLIKVNGTQVTLETDPRGRPVRFADNYVITSKYTLLNFLPVNLFEQFSNLANLYFLGVGILQILPWVTTTQGIPTMYEPLAFIVMVSALRAASEDWNRHKADASRNSYPYDVMRSGGWKPTKSGDLKVGDIVRVKQNDMIPTDMIFMGSALSKGHCFIDKANLNGETTLEVMSSVQATRSYCKDEKSMATLNFELEYEPPNTKFDSFRGWLTITSQPSASISLDGKALLMRETNLRNAEFIIGLVVYTGDDTKIQMSNSMGEKSKVKKSRIMRLVDKFLKYMLLTQIGLCLFCGIAAGAWNTTHQKDHYYLNLGDQSSGLVGFLAFFSWFILLSQMLPISLIVSAEMVKFFQSIFIQWDVSLYHIPINKRAKCNSSTIHEDLGLVDYIFSDKTGTLTQNRMQFRYALIPAADYGSKETEIAKSVKLKNAEVQARLHGEYEPKEPVPWTALLAPLLPPVDKNRRLDCCERSCFSRWWSNPHRAGDGDEEDGRTKSANEFTEEERQALLKGLWGPPSPGESAEQDRKKKYQLRRYMVHMALSNTVKPYEHEGELRFQAESAEELAMVQFARSCGFLKRSQNPTILEIKEFSPDLKSHTLAVEKYNHLATFGFSSKRARVTVIYQRQSDGQMEVMVKGQDSVVLPLLKNKIVEESTLLMQLKELGTNGLRTLLAGDAILPTQWWESRAPTYQDLITRDDSEFSEGHSAGKCVKAKCEKCARDTFFEETEKSANLSYLGCIGMEDQLQLLVPETIRDCLRAGIKVWMITGDKLDTAKNIGLACNLIDPDMQPVFSANSSVEECVEAFNNSRLVEVTGQWASLVDDDEEIGKLFDMFDIDGNSRLDLNELDFCLKALKCSVEPATMRKLFDGVNTDHNDKGISKSQFVTLMRSTKLSKYEAVLYDIEEGIKRYNTIDDHLANPVSILVNRDAFLVMFPPKVDVNRKDTQNKAEATEEQLETLRQKFFLLASVSKSVIFARAEPAMKKRMVTEIMARVPQAVALAVGDGANDTDMIKAAHIGIGIAGVEGTAAVNSADYAIGTFRMLHTLIFAHGYWNYQRVSDLVYYIFYKAALVAITPFFFCFFSGFSGQQFFNDPPYQLYNVVFTALPVIIVAVFDKKLPKATLENNPSAFREQKGNAFTAARFFRWILRAFVHGIILFFIAYGAVGDPDVVTPNGIAGGIWAFSIVVFLNVVITAGLLICFDMASISMLHFLSVTLSLLAIFILIFLLNIVRGFNPNLYHVMSTLYNTPTMWLTLIVGVSIPLLMELAFRAAKREFRPSFQMILQEKLRLKRKDLHKTPGGVKGGAIQLDSGSSAVSSPKAGTAASAQVVTSHHEEEKWASVKHPKTNKATRSEDALKALEKNRLSIKDRNEGKVREAVVRAMLRFRNLTGGQFDSAAQAKWQTHDPMIKSGKGGRDESKVPEGPLDV